MEYKATQRSDGGFNYTDAQGNPISAYSYARGTNTPFMNVLQRSIEAGDTGAQNFATWAGNTFNDPGVARPTADVINSITPDQIQGAWDDRMGSVYGMNPYDFVWQDAQSQSAPTQGGSGGAALNQSLVDNTQRTIDEIPGLLAKALATEQTRYGNARRDFETQEEQQRGAYDQSTTTNQQNYDSTFMDSIRAGVRGLSGLFSLLRGTGAGGSSVEGQVRDVVGGQTAQDIRGGADVRNENQTQLDSSLSSFLTGLDRKRQENEDIYANNQRAVRRDSNTQLQDLYSQMAGFYGDAGQTDQATQWLNRAGELTPQIAQNSVTQLSQYDTTPVEVQAPQLTAFARPNRPNISVGRSPQEVGSGIFAISNRREEEENRAPNLVTAGV